MHPMTRVRFWFATLLFGLACLLAPAAQSQPVQPKAKPRLEPVAETRLLMEGLADPNARALGKLLVAKPKDADGWRSSAANHSSSPNSAIS
jgi:hypothetical protein